MALRYLRPWKPVLGALYQSKTPGESVPHRVKMKALSNTANGGGPTEEGL